MERYIVDLVLCVGLHRLDTWLIRMLTIQRCHYCMKEAKDGNGIWERAGNIRIRRRFIRALRFFDGTGDRHQWPQATWALVHRQRRQVETLDHKTCSYSMLQCTVFMHPPHASCIKHLHVETRDHKKHVQIQCYNARISCTLLLHQWSRVSHISV
jgi:hypothetical protein